MSLMVGSARIDENGKISGGKPGDQTGNEVSTQPYYVHSKGWICMRPKNVAVANAIAEAMIQACKNNNIGYCQGHRITVIEQLRKSGSLAKIPAKTEADCSSLVRACCTKRDLTRAISTHQPRCPLSKRLSGSWSLLR